MNTFHTPHLTSPEQSLPALELPMFSDVAAHPDHVAKLGSGAERLVNTTLAVGMEATKLQGKGEEAVSTALTAGKLVVELAVFNHVPGADPLYRAAPGIFVVSSAHMPEADANPTWRSLLTLDGDTLEISTSNPTNSQASATFRRDESGIYTPRQFTYGEQLSEGPYVASGQTLSVNGLMVYKRLLHQERPYSHTALKARFRGLALLGTTANEIRERLTVKAARTTAYVAIESETFTPKPWWTPVEKTTAVKA